jgi:hypothetical protein
VTVLRHEKGERENIINIERELELKRLIRCYMMVLEIMRMKFHPKGGLVSLKFNIVLERDSEKIKAKE